MNLGVAAMSKSDFVMTPLTPDEQSMVEKNLPLAKNIARKFYKKYRHLDLDDLTSQGYLGIIRAVKTHDPSKGAFSTHASLWIFHYIGKYILGNFNIVSRTSRIAAAAFWRGETITDAYMDLWQWERIFTKRNHLDGIESRELSALMQNILNSCHLSDREKIIVQLRAMSDGPPLTLRELAGIIHVSKERVRQVEARALTKLRTACNEFIPDLEAYLGHKIRGLNEGESETLRGMWKMP